MKYTTILFDLDGTLLYTLEDLQDAVNYMMNKEGLKNHNIESIRKFVGNGLKKLLERSFPDGINHPNFEDLYVEFLDYYNSHNLIKTAPYNGVIDVTKTLADKNINMAIVTNKSQEASDILINKFFAPNINCVAGICPGRNPKPAKDTVDAALNMLGISDKSSVLYVGDSEVDAQTAINSNLDYILCTYGFRDKKDLEIYKPIAFIDNINELLNFF